jgi:hypothetical protein
LAKDSAGVVIVVCPKYAPCFADTATVVMQSDRQIVLTKRAGNSTIIERCNLNTLEIEQEAKGI